MADSQTFHSTEPFALEGGASLPELTLAYHTYGQLNADRSNVVWICHALTGSSDAADWWSGLVGEGKLFDPRQHFIVCANVPGSSYGSTSALSVNALTGQPFYRDFPLVTVRDVVRAFDRLRDHLGVTRIQTCIGGSLGGQQALEWAISQVDLIENLILVATNAQMSPWGVAFNEAQRMAIAADATWPERHPEAGRAGLKAARAVALLSYRNYETYHITQSRQGEDTLDNFRATTYQQYQGEKLARRFNAFAYWALSKLMDSHDVGRGRGGMEVALSQIKARTLVLGIRSDVLFPMSEQHFLAKHIPGAEFTEIDSLYGHDGFLIENELMTKAIRVWQFSQQPDESVGQASFLDGLKKLFRERVA
ncbi:MAG: homoserine O-acetyltransferase [Cytophagaceae bacterium]|nr:homoserine O-acetyltransferase [Cytophagaceae bacterium]